MSTKMSVYGELEFVNDTTVVGTISGERVVGTKIGNFFRCVGSDIIYEVYPQD